MFDEIERVIASALRMDAETPDAVGVELRFVGVSLDAFDRFREAFAVEDGDLVFAKCACGDCGNLVVAFQAEVRDGDARVLVDLARSATEAETIEYLERLAAT